MKYRIHEICREKGILMKDLAKKMDRTPESLSRSLNNGTTTKILQEIADNLGVKVVELFDGYVNNNKDTSSDTIGIIRHQGIIYEINSLSDIENILKKMKKASV